MKLRGNCSNETKRTRVGQSAFTLVELVAATAAASLVIGSALVFMSFARVSVSGITAQTIVGNKAGYGIEFIQSRIRLATSVTVDATGNTLTLGFDDNYQVDSDGDGIAYNDKDHYETFQFSGANGTDAATAATNRLIYTPKVGSPGNKIILPFGVRNLPGYNIFMVPSPNTAVIRFGMVDPNARDRFQSIDIQAVAVSLNRPTSSNVISILPY